MMRLWLRGLFVTILVSASLTSLTAQPAAAKGCTSDGTDLHSVRETCEISAHETENLFASGDGHRYAISLTCDVGGSATCLSGASCGSEQGMLFDVFRDGALIARTCLTDAKADSLGQLTPGGVRKAFERLTWPGSELAVQPPDGVTLVGFESNFFTTSTAPTTQAVTLLGRQIQIEATPISYVWHFGDESSETTTTPGAAYPQLLVTHRYQHIGKVQPSVDTVYAGRYRVGTGPWRAIPGTLTVTGQQQELEVREARGVLVGH